MKQFAHLLPVLLAFAGTAQFPASAQSTAFTYQGLLMQNGVPSAGTFDLQFALYDDPALGSQVGKALTNAAVLVSNGLFVTPLDFGAVPFTGQDRWLHIGVRPSGIPGGFLPLFPRQPISAAPYAIRAGEASGAITAPWSGLSGVPAGFADGIDNDTQYTAGAGLSLAGGAFSIANSGVGTTQLANGAVTALKLANGAVLTEILDNDGAGSGLDADRLDGLDSTAFAPRNSPTFTGTITGEKLEISGAASLHGSVPDSGLTIHSFGGVSVGTTNSFFSSGGSFYVRSSANFENGVQMSQGTNAFRFDVNTAGNLELWRERLRTNGANGSLMMLVTTNGEVGIGTSTPQFLLHVDGSAGKPGGGSWSVASDARVKKNIHRLAGTLDRLLQLRGVNFEYTDPQAMHELAGVRTGFIAQEVETVFPDWVETGPDGYQRLTVRGFEALVVEALRELRSEKQARLDALEETIAALQQTVAALADRANLPKPPQ